MLSIKDFSEMSGLTPQTLRHYHTEGLLVPARVDAQTGYRSYDFPQVEQAVLVTALRGAGLSVKQVRAALDAPETAPDLLERHVAEVAAQRRAQDEAIADARVLLTAAPEAHTVTLPGTIVVTTLTAHRDVPAREQTQAEMAAEWDLHQADVAESVRELTALVAAHGGTVTGAPWYSWPDDAEIRTRMTRGEGGPYWQVSLPVADEPAALPEGVWTRVHDAVPEAYAIRMPGRSTLAKYCTALARLTARTNEDSYPDMVQVRFTVYPDGVETSMPVIHLTT